MERLIVPIGSIVVAPERGRKVFTRIDELAESIKTQGMINPIFVSKHHEEGKYNLVAGERRFRASVLAGLKEIPISYKEDLSALDQKIIELEENVCRVDLDWQEEAELHRQINELQQTKNPQWQQKQTAELVQVTPGHLSLQISIAKKLRENAELRKEVGHLPIRAAMKVIEQREQVEKVNRLKAEGKLKITADYRCGDCRDLIRQIPDNSIDLIVCDPPYGLEHLEDLRTGGGDAFTGHQLMSEYHNQSITSVLALLREMAPQLVRVLKPGAHWYIFSGYQYIGDFIEALKPLECQFPILHWDRQKPTTPGFGYNYLNRTEAIIYGHKPPKGRRLAQNKYNILEHPEVPRNLRVYPTEKPQSLLKELIAQSSNQNDIVLDFCAGSGSTLKAAKTMGRRSIGFEIDLDSWKRSLLSMQGDGWSVEPTLF